MTQKIEPQDEKARLKKKIEEYTQFQWLALMPAWLPGILAVIRHTPTAPGREIYVLIFRVGMFVLGVAAFAWVRVRLKKMQNQLQRLEDPANQQPAPYEPPLPRG